MAKKLFSYPQDSEEEADSLKSLLQNHNIEYYETPGNQWTYTRASLWIKDDDDFSRANELLQKHIVEFAQTARAKYQAETGYDPSANGKTRLMHFLFHLYRKKALIPVLGIAIFFIYLYFKLFFSLFNQ